jgi:hypothetical protein
MKKTMNELLTTEAQRINNGYCYCSRPYPCTIMEALAHFRKFDAPDDPSIEREHNRTTITVKPLKGSGKRKPYIITLWWPD